MQWLNLGMEDSSLQGIKHSEKVIEALLGEIEAGVLDGSDPDYTGEDIMDLKQTSVIFSEVIIIINVIINVNLAGIFIYPGMNHKRGYVQKKGRMT